MATTSPVAADGFRLPWTDGQLTELGDATSLALRIPAALAPGLGGVSAIGHPALSMNATSP
jgi:hypothetical protein